MAKNALITTSMDKSINDTSKFLSYILRHEPLTAARSSQAFQRGAWERGTIYDSIRTECGGTAMRSALRGLIRRTAVVSTVSLCMWWFFKH